MPPELQAIDHIHIYVTERDTAESWYKRVLGLFRCEALEFWAKEGGPLTLQNGSGSVHIALFERTAQPCRSTVALRVGGAEYHSWKVHLEHQMPGQITEMDHQASLSLYFKDPDGNPYEITTYETDAIKNNAQRTG